MTISAEIETAVNPKITGIVLHFEFRQEFAEPFESEL